MLLVKESSTNMREKLSYLYSMINIRDPLTQTQVGSKT